MSDKRSGPATRPGATKPIIGRRRFLAGTAASLLAAPAVMAQGDTRRFANSYGETVVTGTPRRVISIGFNTLDAILALGVMPVALRYWYGPYENGIWPWAQGAASGDAPIVMQGEIAIETVAATRPDLIVALGSGISEAEYQMMSSIAPVLLQHPDMPVYGTPWDEGTRLIGQAMNRAAQAEKLIADVQADFAACRARHPDWAGKTAVAAFHSGGQTGVYLRNDGRTRFLQDLGLQMPKAVADIDSTSFYANLSPEDLSALEADAIVWISSQDSVPDLINLPMRQSLGAVRQGREVFAGVMLGGALSFASVLSMPWALKQIEPELVAALDGDPATPAPSAVAAGLAP